MLASECVVCEGEGERCGDEQRQQTGQAALVHAQEVALVQNFYVHVLEAVRTKDAPQNVRHVPPVVAVVEQDRFLLFFRFLYTEQKRRKKQRTAIEFKSDRLIELSHLSWQTTRLGLNRILMPYRLIESSHIGCQITSLVLMLKRRKENIIFYLNKIKCKLRILRVQV